MYSASGLQHPLIFLHVAYFCLLSLLGAVGLRAAAAPAPAPAPSPSLAFADALFNAVSAVSETGVASVAMHCFSISGQIILVLLMLVGSPVFTSAIPLFIMRFYSHKHASISRPSSGEMQEPPIEEAAPPLHKGSSLSNKKHAITTPLNSNIEVMNELGAPPPSQGHIHIQNNQQALEESALVVMMWVTTCYFLVSIVGGTLLCFLCIEGSPHALAALKDNRVSPIFFSLFSTVSAFGNCGLLPLDTNLVPLQRCSMLVLWLAALMLMGNTCYPAMLRFILTFLHKTSTGPRKQAYAHLLLAPERRYTHLFPFHETTWLVATLAFLHAFQIVSLLCLNWKSQAFEGLGAGYKFVASLVQSICARTGGMNVIDLSPLSTSSKFVLVATMYVAAYPIHLKDKKENEEMWNSDATKAKQSVFREQLLRLRAQDSFLFLATFLICILERESIQNDPLNFSFLSILFEVVSSYGNTGLSLGYSCGLRTDVSLTSVCSRITYSLSGKWSVASKMVLVVVMLVGRHKGLPIDIDWKSTP